MLKSVSTRRGSSPKAFLAAAPPGIAVLIGARCPVSTAIRAHSMFVAHIPSGYIMAVSRLKRVRHFREASSAVIAAGMIGSIGPDFDMVYFYLVDHRQTHHHRYVTPYAMFTVPALFKPWWLNFFFHWSFGAELIICLLALTLYRRRSNKRLLRDCQQRWRAIGNR